MNKAKKTKGESLLEGIIAFTILGMGIAFSGVIMGTSIRNMDNAKNRVIAINAAREGIEAVRNIRDTNWLKYSTKRRSCWNHMPQKDQTTGCTSKLIEPGRYIIYKQDGTLRWMLSSISSGNATITQDNPPDDTTKDVIFYNNINENLYGVDNSTWVDARTLYAVDINDKVNSDKDDSTDGETNDQDFLNHIFIKDDGPWGTKVKKTSLKREIIIEYLDNSGNVPAANIDINKDIDYNRMRVTSKVTWLKGGKEFKVELKTHLTDYLGREKLAG